MPRFEWGPPGGLADSRAPLSARRRPGEPDRQLSPDADLTHSFAVGCVVLFLVFLLLTALVYYFWTH